jgi:hypothetical protein
MAPSITVAATDTLEGIRDKLNAANTGGTPTGVTAAIVKEGTTGGRLVLTRDASGSSGINLTDGTGGMARELGFPRFALQAGFVIGGRCGGRDGSGGHTAPRRRFAWATSPSRPTCPSTRSLLSPHASTRPVARRPSSPRTTAGKPAIASSPTAMSPLWLVIRTARLSSTRSA